MRCDEVLVALDTLAAGGAPDRATLDELLGSGLVARAPVAAGAIGVASLRDDLKRIQARRQAAREALAAADAADRERLRGEVTALDREERELRTAILELADLPAVGESVPQLTFRGRDLVGELRTRVGRVGDQPLATFLAAFGEFRSKLSATAERASSLLGVLSPAHPALDEIHLRATAISLVTGQPQVAPADLAQRFTAAVAALGGVASDDEGLVQLAETCVASDRGTGAELATFARDAATRITDRADAVSAATIAWGEGPADRQRVLLEGIELAKTWGPGEAAPAVLLVGADGAGRAGAVPGLIAELSPVEPDTTAVRWSAALLALSPAPGPVALARFQQVRAWLSRFGTDGLSAPAAMLVLLDADAPELLDDLRLASNAVREHRLSLSALENLALGVKLLVEVGLGRVAVPVGGGALSAVVGLDAAAATVALPLSRFPPRFTQAVASYHRATIHHRVVRHDWSHPVHTHRIYG